MSIERNKQTALAFLKSLSTGQPDASLLCDDAHWWVPGMGTIDRAGFFAISDAFQTFAKKPVTMEISAVTAEEDRVAVEASGRAELKDGRIYANTYHFLFRLRDGKIFEAREHNDSQVPAALFGNAFKETVG